MDVVNFCLLTVFFAAIGAFLGSVWPLDWPDAAMMIESVRGHIRRHFHATSTTGPTPDLTIQLLRLHLADARRNLFLMGLCAYAMGWAGREWGEHVEHELHAGVHDCAVVAGPAHLTFDYSGSIPNPHPPREWGRVGGGIRVVPSARYRAIDAVPACAGVQLFTNATYRMERLGDDFMMYVENRPFCSVRVVR